MSNTLSNIAAGAGLIIGLLSIVFIGEETGISTIMAVVGVTLVALSWGADA